MIREIGVPAKIYYEDDGSILIVLHGHMLDPQFKLDIILSPVNNVWYWNICSHDSRIMNEDGGVTGGTMDDRSLSVALARLGLVWDKVHG